MKTNKRHAILYARITETNLAFLNRQANKKKDEFPSLAAFVDNMVSKYRKQVLAAKRARK